MPFTLKIDTENDEFKSDGSRGRYTIARMLTEIADKLQGGRSGGFVLDANGNVCGTWDYADDESDKIVKKKTRR